MRGILRIGRRGYRLRPAVRSAAAGKRVRQKARLSARGRSALRRALASGRRPKVRVRIGARDGLGNRSRQLRATVRARR